MQTYGWDSVFVLNVVTANQQLAVNMDKLVETFDFAYTAGLAPTQIQGVFDPWQIVPGGSNKIIQMKFPIQSGTMSIAGIGDYKLDGVSVELQISLDILPSTVAVQSNVLAFDFSGNTVSDATGITYVSTQDPANQVPGTYESLLGDSLIQCLLSNTEAITYVFATIDLMPASESWLTPLESVFCYQQPINSSAAYLSILSMTTSQDVSQMSRNVDASLLNASYDWAMAISPGMFLKGVIQPTLPSVFGNGTTASTFTYKASLTAIQNTQSFGVGKVTSGLIDYYPQITGLTMSINNNALKSVTSGNCDLYAGISMTFTITSNNVMVFNAGNQTFTFNTDPNPTETHDDDIPLWEEVLLLGVVDVVMAVVVKFIADDIADKLNTITGTRSFAGVTPYVVEWTGMNQLDVKAGGLSSSFYMQGLM
ncbi:MAG: hypothetical protein EOO39_02890 [Cytophagaceae bacterium]|nr:MAG: hypothetical protein EOO39_02890 [Cytophagaceae bacterium]